MGHAACIRHLRDYVAIPSVNPMQRDDLPERIVGERRYAEHLREQLRRLGVDVELVGPAERPSVIACARASGARAAETLAVASHLDTVPIDGMQIDPFDPRIEGGRLFGRGACDTKAGMAALDYPAAKLEVLLVLEAEDAETRAALDPLDLPGNIRPVVVPDKGPRTKPKALNYALELVRSPYVVVYDAEDIPEPDQLRRALAAFAEGGADIACVQARLGIHNTRQGWLPRQFALEYASLFDAQLPSLQRLGLPIPLGGTSNHFRGIA